MADFVHEDFDSATPGEEMIATSQVALQEEAVAASSPASGTGLRLVAGLELVPGVELVD